MKKLFIVSMMAVSGFTIVQGAIPVGTTGSGIINFATRPAAAEWSTASSGGNDMTFGTAAQMDAAVQGITATSLNIQVFDAAPTNPPAQNPIASWTGGGSAYLQTRPTGNAGTALMATLRNDTGINANSLTITYRLNESGTAPVEQIPGHLVYVSLSGGPNSWMPVPALSGGAIGLKSNTVVLPGGWASGTLLYVLWADDNADTGTDRGYQIDDVAFFASPDAVPLSVTLAAPASNALLIAPADVRVIANANGTIPPAEVSFYTNDVLFSVHTAPPYSNQLINLPPGIYSIYAVAVNGTETAYSRTNTVKVRDEFVHYFGGTHTEDFDGMGRVNGETPIGWYVGAALPANIMTVTVGDGSAGAATAVLGWNYGLITGVDRALGTAPTGADRNMVVHIQNNTSSNIISFEIRYDGEVWRNYTNGVGGWLTNLVSFDLGASWIPTAFNFSQPFTPAEPQSAIDGNAAANRIANIGGVVTPPAPVAPGSVVYIRWHDFNDGGVTDGGLAIDNFSFTATLEQFMSFVTITRPTNEATFPEAAPIIINATAAMENPISHVSFFRDGILIGDDTNAPYSAVYSNSTPGVHALTATAYDGQGLSVTVATPIQITVSSNVLPGITITNPPDGGVYFVGVTVSNISASVFDQDGAVVRVEFYLDGDLWATDTNSPYSFDLCDITAGPHTIQAVAVDNANGRANHSISITATNPPGIGIIIANGSTWKYLDDGSDQGSVWRELMFDDSGWSNGVAELGYGDRPGRPERTMVGFGPNPNAKNPTTYFRKIFSVNNPAFFSNVILRLLRDDHAIVYLNGNQVFSDVTTAPVDFSTYTPPASADDGTVYEATNVPVALLTPGPNILAVEVHQDVGTSSDISFDLMLWAQGGQPEPPMIGTQPQRQTVTVGSSATFDVDVSGSPPFSYQWHLNCRDIPEGTNRVLTIQGARFEDAGNYSVTIRNAFGQITSWDAGLSVSNVVEPILKINRAGNSNITLRWPRREVPYRLQELPKIEPPGPTKGLSQRWTDSDASFELSGQDLLGDVDSAGMSKFFRVISPSIRIITHPEGRSANLDETITLSVVATGAPPVSYQWRFNGFPLIGETNPAISILINRSSYGAYQVAVADAKDALLSRAAVLRPAGLETALSDSFQGSSLFIEPTGSLHGLTFGATKEPGEPDHAGLPGGRSVWLAWRAPASGVVTFDTIGSGFDTLLAAYLVGAPGQSSIAADDDTGSNLCSQIRFNVSADNVYNIAIDGLAGAGGFFVLNWSFTQLPQSLSLPIIDLQPVDRIIKSNETTSFTVAAHDLQGQNPQVQWYQNGRAVPDTFGGKSPTLFVGGAQALPLEVGQYYVEVMNSVFTVRSRYASLQISSDPEFRFVSKLLVDSICGFTPYDPSKSASKCCGVSSDDFSKTMETPKLLSAAAGSLTGSLTYGGTPPPAGSRAYWTWVTNGWDCLKLVTLTANVTVAGTPQSCTLVIIDGATGLLVKPADSGMSPNVSNINKAKAGKVYWIALGFDNPSAVGTLSYSFTGTCP